jgi:uncharacterized membrane protein
MNLLCQPILILISLISIIIGLFLFLRPLLAIEMQKKFYARINWRIEPISLEKEIRNTRIMGLFLIIFVLSVLVLKILLYSPLKIRYN